MKKSEAKTEKKMQAVILCAGKSTRTYPLTLTKPKTLLSVANKPIIFYFLDNLKGLVDEVIIVVNYLKEQIIDAVGDSYGGMKITYVEQPNINGTGSAFLVTEPYIKDTFLFMYGDDIYFRNDIEQLLQHQYAMLVKKVPHPEHFGIVLTEKNNKGNKVTSIVEKPAHVIGDLANIGVFHLDKTIFNYKDKLKKSSRGEYDFVDLISMMAKEKDIFTVEAENWLPITYSWSLLDANTHFLSQINQNNISKDAVIEDNVSIKGNIVVGKGSILKSGTYIEGKVVIGEDCIIGPNCYIRGPTSIGNKSKVGNAVEVKASILGNHAVVGHLSYVGDSVLGDNINFGAGTITANLRHDNVNIKSEINGKLIDTGERKLGTIVSDGVHTGVHTSINPGRKLWPNVTTGAGEVVTVDKKEKRQKT
ncbi:NTP transferase domain-containing protein [Candidatus Woesearchaeota archaeon]|nr:NTP transferase domain-containing protein [Candidatus Woesearchaeota archaeon]